eukprot:Hpha_TRINITY_DN14792_c0_g1::TRINITY_DN14792_c0_g1_i1::g.102600::m.102600
MADEEKKPLAAADDDDGPTPAEKPAEEKKEEKKEKRKEKADDDDQEWLVMQSRSQGRPYYYHTKSKETLWEKPADFEDDLPEGEDGWVEMESRTQGRYYFYNKKTRECTWERPAGVPEPPPFERRRPNPKRDALRQIINDWADEFFKEHQREPAEDDIPAGSDIARHHRDYKMLKQEEEVERLKREQTQLRQELSPDSRERLITIKKDLEEMEPKVANWKKTKDDEREKVTTTYNAWIKTFTEKNGRGPTEKDIDPESDISQMFKEYSTYREEARRAKQRAWIEASQKRSRHEKDHRRIRSFMSAVHKKHGRWPSEKDSEIERLYLNYLEREAELNPDSPRAQRATLRRQINEWSVTFEKKNGRRPTSDIPPDSEIADLYKRYDALTDKQRSKERAQASGSKRQTGQTEGTRHRAHDHDDDYATGSPKSYAQYQRNKPKAAGCGDCCRIS